MNLDPHNPVRQVAACDYSLSGFVRVNEARISALSPPADLQTMGSLLPGSPLQSSVRAYVPYFIAMNTMNFHFWDVRGNGEFVRYANNGLVGSLAMQTGFHDAWVRAMSSAGGKSAPADVANSAAADLRKQIQVNGLEPLFGDIPDPFCASGASRREILDEVLNPTRLAMASSYLGDRVFVDQALGWADAQVLAQLFPKAYGDDYLKKAQLTLMFIASEWNAAQPEGGKPVHLNVTAAADYQLPKVLRALGILDYSPELANKVDNGELIEADSLEELGIRAATIYACDKLAEHFGATIEEVDFWLWSKRNANSSAKFHLTHTTNY